jgi:adenosylhomocysteine nucleosidase
VPFSIVRTISDKADHTAGVDFLPFVGDVARYYSLGIVRELTRRLATL